MTESVEKGTTATVQNSAGKRKRLAFQFTGNAAEYFSIWFANQLLMMITLGFYAPWAKVRKLRYFYGNTTVANGSFQFLASPLTLLKSRLLALLLLIMFMTSKNLLDVSIIAASIYGIMTLLYIVFAPVIFVMMLSFRMRYSAWRSIKFSFNRDYKGAYRVYMAPNLVVILFIACLVAPFYFAGQLQEQAASEQTAAEESLSGQDMAYDEGYSEDEAYAEESYEEGRYEQDLYEQGMYEEEFYDEDSAVEDESITNVLDHLEAIWFLPAALSALILLFLAPYFDFISMRYVARNARFGTATGQFVGEIAAFYRVYGVLFIAIGVLILLWTLKFALDVSGMYGVLGTLTGLFFLLIRPYMKAKRYNLMLDNVQFGNGHRLRANAKPLAVCWLTITNSLIILLSFWMLSPWTQVRTARYFLGVTALESTGDITEFLAGQEEDAKALAEEISDVFDLELSF
ncbi:MAG: DUF898 domain-containing protein [Pseudomonadales bacterium]|nr:DUF898 domain-containing protein [Pseudomonadales bacterium]